ncbi:Y4bD/Y4pK family protein [Acidithiobacillus ferrivorans]
MTTRRQNWGEDRVMYYNAKGRLCSILASWTSVPEMDFFAQASAGQSWFRTDDLLQLSALIGSLRETHGDK